MRTPLAVTPSPSSRSRTRVSVRQSSESAPVFTEPRTLAVYGFTSTSRPLAMPSSTWKTVESDVVAGTVNEVSFAFGNLASTAFA